MARAPSFGQRHPPDATLEMIMKSRSIILLLALFVLSLSIASPSYARTFDLTQNVSHGQLQSACNAAGGTFSDAPDGSGYACGTNCKGGKGTNCYVACGNDGKCVGSTPGRLIANVTLGQLFSGAYVRNAIALPDDSGTPSHTPSAASQPDPAPTPAGVPVLQ